MNVTMEALTQPLRQPHQVEGQAMVQVLVQDKIPPELCSGPGKRIVLLRPWVVLGLSPGQAVRGSG